MRGYQRIIPLILCIFSLVLFTNLSKAQSIAQIENIDFYPEDSKLVITYDIIKASTGEKFNVWVSIKAESGHEFKPVSIYGDLGKWVTGGINKKIYWDLDSDGLTLDEEISVEVFAQSELEKPTPADVKHQVAEAERQVLAKEAEYHRNVDIGVGMLGVDYGGIIGLKVEYIPINHLGVFASIGVQLTGFAWQTGAIGYFIRKTNKKGFRPYGKFMFGTNAFIFVQDYTGYNSSYLGPSIGVGMEIRFGGARRSGMNFDLNFPFRSQEFKDDWENVKNLPGIEVVAEPWPFTISVGYHVEF